MIQSKLNYIIALFIIMFIPLTAFAADFHVTTNQELQTALSTANSNGVDDIVYLSAGTYAGHFSYQPNESQAITIQAEAGLNPGQVVLDGNSNGRTLLLSAGNNVADMTVDRLTITNGQVGSGNGLYANTAGNITITKCTISNCRYTSDSVNGGGGWLKGHDILIQNSTITGNVFTSHRSKGAGLYIESVANLSLSGNIFSYNELQYIISEGGGLYVNTITSGASINNNHFYQNKGHDFAGAFKLNSSSAITLSIDSNTVEHNTGSGGVFIDASSSTCNMTNNTVNNNGGREGGGVRINANNINFSNNNVFNNSGGDTDSRAYGAGMVLDASNTLTVNNNIIKNNRDNAGYAAGCWLRAPTMTVTNNIIAGNTATYAGGLLINSSNTLHFTNNTVYDNTASGGAGGGVYTYAGGAGGLHFYNNIIWGNSASGQGDDLYLTGTGSADKNFKYNSIHDYGGTLFNFVSNIIDVDPLFIDSSNDDFHLGAASLCLDVGLNTAPGIPATDLDGNARVSNTTVDLGAYEHSTGDYHPADTNTDWNITGTEFTAYSDSWKTTASPIEIDYVTRAGYLLQNGSPTTGDYKNIGGGKPLCWVPRP